jgi:Flp pilus assembly protein TadG
MRKSISPHTALAAFALRAAPRSLTAFGRSTKAIAAVEFAIILPIMLIVALGSVETARMLTFSRRLNLVANTTVQMLTVSPPASPPSNVTIPPPNTNITSGNVAYTDLHTAQDSAMVIFPQVLQDAVQKGVSWSNDIQISMASIRFVPTVLTCTTSCTYQAAVVWYSGSNHRPCGINQVKAAANDTSTPSPTTLPKDLFPSSSTAPSALYSAGSVIVVDVDYTYKPLFTSKFFGQIRMQRSAYVAPRYVQLVLYDSTQSGDDGIGHMCPTF